MDRFWGMGIASKLPTRPAPAKSRLDFWRRSYASKVDLAKNFLAEGFLRIFLWSEVDLFSSFAMAFCKLFSGMF
jgi:hypothetical protein